jgi:TrmH family RNA methyltransferase
VQRLRRLSRRRAARLEEGAFVVEGPLLVAEALEAGLTVHEVLVATGVAPELAADAARRGITVREVVPDVLARSLDAATPQGAAAVVAAFDVPLEEACATAESGTSVVLADVGDPGNAGTLVRAAEASGARAVLFTTGSVDPTNPKCVRAAAGALFHLPVSREGDAEAVLGALGERGIRRVATVARGGAPYDDVDLTGPVALVLGNEAHGLPAALDGLVDERVTIPMAGRTESLNVAMAGAVLCFEALRQRRAR